MDIKEYFSRHFLGKIGVHSLSADIEPPCVNSPRKTVETHPLRTAMNVMVPAMLSFHGGIRCSNGGFRMTEMLVSVHGERMRNRTSGDVKSRPVPLMKHRLKTREAVKRMMVLPQERINRLKWQRARPKLAPGEMVLAWYGPLIEGATVKMALNRHRGTLLVWYNPQSRHFKSGGIFMCQRLGVKEKPQWRWM